MKTCVGEEHRTLYIFMSCKSYFKFAAVISSYSAG